MVVPFRVALALLPLLSDAIVVKELPNPTGAKAVEQPQQMALIQEHAAIAKKAHSAIATHKRLPGIPIVGSSVQIALAQIMNPVKDGLQSVRQLIVEPLKALDKGLGELEEKPGEALAFFATKFTDIFHNVVGGLSLAIPATEGLTQATVTPHAADNIANIMTSMGEEITSYQRILISCTEILEFLRKLGQSDWPKAGQKVAELKKSLDRGASTLKSFGSSLRHRFKEALFQLAVKLEVDASTFLPILQAVDDSWRYLEESSSALAGGMANSSQSLPPQIGMTAPDGDGGKHSGATAAGALGALAATAAAALVL